MIGPCCIGPSGLRIDAWAGQRIVLDNGPEFAGRTLDSWAYAQGVELRFIRPGKPIENAYVESFNGKFRVECSNEHWFMSLAEARAVIEILRLWILRLDSNQQPSVNRRKQTR